MFENKKIKNNIDEFLIAYRKEYNELNLAMKDICFLVGKYANYNYTEFDYEDIDFNDSFNIVLDFYKYLDINLYNDFINLMSFQKDKVVFKKYNESDISSVNYGYMNIYVRNNITDMFIIVHETIHKLYYNNKSKKWNKYENIFCEVPSITMEYLLYNYLIKNDIYSLEATKYMKNKFNIDKDAAISILFDMSLIDKYLENRRVSLFDINEYVKNIENINIKEYIKHNYKSMYDEAKDYGLWIFDRFKYVIGFYLGTYYTNNYDDKETYKIISNMGNYIFNAYSLDELLSASKLNEIINTKCKIKLNVDNISNLDKSFNKKNIEILDNLLVLTKKSN